MLTDIFSRPGGHISFEFFPPKDDSGMESICQTIRSLKKYKPDFVSITWGAGGSTVRKSLEIASTVTSEMGVLCIAHFTGLGMKKSDVDGLLEELKKRNVNNVLVLRGDIPHDADRAKAFPDGFRHASELVKYIRSRSGNQSNNLGILVAGCPEGHPEAESFDSDMDHTAHKVREGAEGIITQLFFDNKYYYNFVREMKKRNIRVPIIAGIMIVTHSRQINKIVELSGCTVPQELGDAIARYTNDDSAMELFGIEFATRQVRGLIESGFGRFHFYTMNRPDPASKLLDNLKKELSSNVKMI